MTKIIVNASGIISHDATGCTVQGQDIYTPDGGFWPASQGWTLADTGLPLPADIAFSPSNYEWTGSAYSKMADTPAQIQAALVAKLTALVAYNAQRQGALVTIASVGGFPTTFSPDWLGLINGAYLAAQADSSFTTEWEDQSDVSHTLTAAQVITLWRAGQAYTNACFANNSAHKRGIRALTSVAAVAAYDYTTGWPSVSL